MSNDKNDWHTRRGQQNFLTYEDARAFWKFLCEKGRNPELEHPTGPSTRLSRPIWTVEFDPSPRLPEYRHSHEVCLQHWGRPEYRSYYGNAFKQQPDFKRCGASVFDNCGSSQCSKTAHHDPDHTGEPTRCGIHARARVRAKEEKMWADHEARKQQRTQELNLKEAKEDALRLVQEIADGHNDPRGAARSLLSKYGMDRP